MNSTAHASNFQKPGSVNMNNIQISRFTTSYTNDISAISLERPESTTNNKETSAFEIIPPLKKLLQM